MTTLKNSDRKRLMHRVLHGVFQPRFLELNKEIQAGTLACMKLAHPEFYKLAAAPELRKYLASNRVRKFIFHYRTLIGSK